MTSAPVSRLSPANSTAESFHPPGLKGEVGYSSVFEAYREVAELVTTQADLISTLELIVKNASLLLGVDRCSIFLRDSHSGLFKGQAAHAADGHIFLKKMLCGVPADQFTQEIVSTRVPVLIRDARRDPRPVRSTMVKLDIRTILGVPMVYRESVIGLMFLDQVGKSRNYTAAEQTLMGTFANLAATAVAQVTDMCELRDNAGRLKRHVVGLRRAADSQKQFFKAALDGIGPPAVAKLAAEGSRKPCSVYDSALRVVATALPDGMVGPPPRLLDAAAVGHGEIAAAIGALPRDEATILDPFPNADIMHRNMVAPITTGEHDVWGHLVLAETGQRLTYVDEAIARSAANSLSVQVRLLHQVSTADIDDLNRLGHELIAESVDLPTVKNQAAFHGIDLEGPHVVCLIKVLPERGEVASLPALSEMRHAFITEYEARGPVLISTADSGIVLVVALADDGSGAFSTKPVEEALRRALVSVDESRSLVGVVSTVAREAAVIPAAYESSRQIMRCLLGLCPETTMTLSAAELGVGRLILASSEPGAARKFMEEAIGPLLDDETRHEDLLLTLAAFLESHRGVRETARRLDVHENTVRYRLGKIAQVTGLDVAGDPDDQITAHVAMLVWRLTRLGAASASPTAEAGGISIQGTGLRLVPESSA